MIKKRALILLSLAIPFLLFTGLSFSEEKSQSKQFVFLEDIVLSGAQSFFKVEILFIPYTSHRVFELSNPNRIVVDLYNIDNIDASRYFDVNEFGVKAIRAGMVKTDVARVVFDVEEEMPFYEVERIHGGLKIKVWTKEELEEEIEEDRIKETQKEAPTIKERDKKGIQQPVLVSERAEKLEMEIEEAAEKINERSDIIGFVYAKDGTTPLEGASVKFLNVSSNSIYESSKSDANGVFKIEGIESGLYVFGVITPQGDFILDDLVGIRVKENETVKLSVSLITSEEVTLPQSKVIASRDDVVLPAEEFTLPQPEVIASRDEVYLPEQAGIVSINGASSAISFGVLTTDVDNSAKIVCCSPHTPWWQKNKGGGRWWRKFWSWWKSRFG